MENMIFGINSTENRPILASNIVDKGVEGASFNLAGGAGSGLATTPLVPLGQPPPGNALNPGSTFFTTTGVSRERGPRGPGENEG